MRICKVWAELPEADKQTVTALNIALKDERSQQRSGAKETACLARLHALAWWPKEYLSPRPRNQEVEKQIAKELQKKVKPDALT